MSFIIIATKGNPRNKMFWAGQKWSHHLSDAYQIASKTKASRYAANLKQSYEMDSCRVKKLEI